MYIYILLRIKHPMGLNLELVFLILYANILSYLSWPLHLLLYHMNIKNKYQHVLNLRKKKFFFQWMKKRKFYFIFYLIFRGVCLYKDIQLTYIKVSTCWIARFIWNIRTIFRKKWSGLNTKYIFMLILSVFKVALYTRRHQL